MAATNIVMPRYTKNSIEVEKLVRNNKELWQTMRSSPYLRFMLHDRSVVVGTYCSSTGGNNASDAPPWRYYGSVVLKLDSGESREVDLLDVESVSAAPARART